MDGTGGARREAVDIEGSVFGGDDVEGEAGCDAGSHGCAVLALTALAREVPAERRAAVQDRLLHGVEQRLDKLMLSPQTDAAVAADLGRLMCALGAGPF